MLKGRGRGVAGFIVGVGLGLIFVPWLIQRAFALAVPEAPKYVRADFSIVDAVTGQPLEVDITIRRERADGMLIEPEMFYNGHHIALEVPVDGYRTWLLVEKPGYKDWERELVPDTLITVSVHIRLVPLSKRAVPPFPQG